MASEAYPVLGLTPEEFSELESIINTHHKFEPSPEICSSIIAQRIDAPAHTVWPLVRSFENPQKYKHFVKSCNMRSGDGGGGGIRRTPPPQLPLRHLRQRVQEPRQR
ncbi:Abscisic acid receptor PYL2 [Glycine soja]|nr:Abscisic acid receptor PYL2 [Glycine soja]